MRTLWAFSEAFWGAHFHVLAIKAAHSVVLTHGYLKFAPFIALNILFEYFYRYNQPCRLSLSFQPFWHH